MKSSWKSTTSSSLSNNSVVKSRFSRIVRNSREFSLLDLEAFWFHFSLLEKEWKHFDFTLHFSKKSESIFFTLNYSKKSESFLFSLFTSRTSKTHSRWSLTHPPPGTTKTYKSERRTQTLVYVQRHGLHETLVPINSNFWREGQKELEHIKHFKRPFLKIMFKVPLEGTPRSSQEHLISKAKPPPSPLLLLQFYQGWNILRKRGINLLLLPILTTSTDGCFALCVFLRGRHHR